jgi:DNA-binding PucR family transcriptional regulator
MDFINKALGPLIEYDRTNNTELVSTLAIYLENQFSQQKTAEKCFVHISTLRYRLQRIEEILDITLSSSGQAFNLYVAIIGHEALTGCSLKQGKVEHEPKRALCKKRKV